MKRFLPVLFLAGILFSACSPKIASNFTSRYQPLEAGEKVVVLDVEDNLPENFEMLGSIKIGDTGFTTKNGTYDAVLKLAKEQARQVGGNVVKITEHKSPDFVSSIHRIKADILRVKDITTLIESISEFTLSSHPDYAVIYFYRESGSGALVVYDVHIGETAVFRSKPNSCAEVKVYDDGEVMVWAKTEAKEEISLTVKKGSDYYIRTGVSQGIVIGRPYIEVVSPESGYMEYKSIQQN